MDEEMNYSVVIRTLGTAGEKYQRLLDSLIMQTIKPSEIIVYIADGYPLPKETVGVEKYVYVKKGMVAQRALRYDEVTTEYVLFCDDDILLPTNSVEELYNTLKEEAADVISPDVFNNAQRRFGAEMLMTLSGRMRARRFDKIWGYKVMRTGGYSYNKNPHKSAYRSQTNAGACFFCRKEEFLKIHFEDESWMDAMAYPLGEDQVMFYKMHCMGLKVLTHYKTGIEHLDAGTGSVNIEREHKLIYSDFYFKNIFWHRFIYLPESRVLLRIWSVLCLLYPLLFTICVSLIKLNVTVLKVKCHAIHASWKFIRSKEYEMLPPIIRAEKLR